ncbi:cell wall-binding repeat-containing protein [Romboutsia sp. 1001216sp1]|uniref:cell wall-binding repeat-containing protein n=1 Tax=Romboutsia sp. 1001216sp1 TaxID=2986997 RepID=UPI002330488E|nr:cell wall-binding repeat-containing protein [Romboutsia sp. 1001216sp1]MDB8789328.1 cell wall-binding repeat-containing protein [Romboutsia sp. 1001216sp1]
MNKQAVKFIKTKKALAIGLTASIVATTSAPAFANTTKDKVLAGDDRYKTATAISNEGWASAKEVVIVNSSKVADALSATPFATQKDAPILLSKKDTLGEDTKAELARLKAEKVYIIGGENSVSQKVVEELKAMKIAVDRIKGQDRYETSLEVAKAIDGIKNIEEVAVVSGNKGLPDAISVAPAAGDRNMPVILSATDSLGNSEEWIKSQGIKKSYVVGGVVSDKVMNKLPNAEKIAGEDRHETNAKVINEFYDKVDVENVFYAKSGIGNEDHLVDALAVGPLAAKKNSPVVILGSKLHTAQEDAIARKKVKEMVQVGQGINENSKKALKETQIRETFVVKTVDEFKEALKKANHHDVIEFRPTSKITEDIVIEGDKLMSVRFFGEYTGNVTVKSSGTTVVVDKNADLDKVVVQAPNVSIKNDGSIGSFKPSDDTVLEGNRPNPPSTGGGGGGSVTPPTKPEPPVEEELFTSQVSFEEKSINVSVTPSVDMDLGLLTKDNIKIQYLDAQGKVLKTKDKTWAGYLNDEEGNKYGKGANLPSNSYSNTITAGKKYSTTINHKDLGANVADYFEQVASVKVIVKSGDKEKELVFEKENVEVPPVQEELFTSEVSFEEKSINVSVRPSVNMDLGLFTKDNIKIQYLNAEGKVLKTKDKTWAGYLNDEEGNKYGKGANLPSNNYSNTITAGKKYSTTINHKDLGANVADYFEDVASVKVRVKSGDKEKELVFEKNR